MIGTSFEQVEKESQPKLDSIFAKMRDLNLETYVVCSDVEGHNLVDEIKYIGGMHSNI